MFYCFFMIFFPGFLIVFRFYNRATFHFLNDFFFLFTFLRASPIKTQHMFGIKLIARVSSKHLLRSIFYSNSISIESVKCVFLIDFPLCPCTDWPIHWNQSTWTINLLYVMINFIINYCRCSSSDQCVHMYVLAGATVGEQTVHYTRHNIGKISYHGHGCKEQIKLIETIHKNSCINRSQSFFYGTKYYYTCCKYE